MQSVKRKGVESPVRLRSLRQVQGRQDRFYIEFESPLRAFYVVDCSDLSDVLDGWWRGGKHTGDILATH